MVSEADISLGILEGALAGGEPTGYPIFNSPDEVIDSMQRIGAAMPSSLKETAREGLAITPTAELIKRELDKVTD